MGQIETIQYAWPGDIGNLEELGVPLETWLEQGIRAALFGLGSMLAMKGVNLAAVEETWWEFSSCRWDLELRLVASYRRGGTKWVRQILT